MYFEHQKLVLLSLGAILFIIGTGIERISVRIKKNRGTPYYIGLNKCKKLNNIRKFLSKKRAELDKSNRNSILLIEDSSNQIFKDMKTFAMAPDESRLPLTLVETDTPSVEFTDISTGERIGSTEYPPAILHASSWQADYDNYIMGIEEDAKKYIDHRTKWLNRIGYAMIIVGTLVMAYAGFIVQ